MDVKTGFKQKEEGVIPEGWNLESLGVFATFYKGKGLPKSELDPFGAERCIHYGELFTQYPETIQSIISRTNNSKDSFRSVANDVLMPTSDVTPSGLAKASCVTEDGIILGGDILVIRTNKNHVHGPFLSYVIRHSKEQILQLVTGTTVYHLYAADMKKFGLLLPPVEEQEDIAEALSDVDAYIDSLEQLIAKKRLIKQGAMQELLIPKAGWMEKKLANTAILKARIGWQGLTTAEYLDSGDYFLVTGTEFKGGYVDWDSCHYVSESRYKQDMNIQLKAYDVLVTKDGTIGKVALVTQLEKPATLNSGVFVIRPINNSFHPQFFYYLLLSEVFTEFLNQLSAGSTINHLYQKDFVNFVYQTPKTIGEQETIASVIRDIDEEISLLEKKLSKACQLKLGMMQELLTGRIRLI